MLGPTSVTAWSDLLGVLQGGLGVSSQAAFVSEGKFRVWALGPAEVLKGINWEYMMELIEQLSEHFQMLH